MNITKSPVICASVCCLSDPTAPRLRLHAKWIICFEGLLRRKKNFELSCPNPAVVVGCRCLTSCLSSLNGGEKNGASMVFVWGFFSPSKLTPARVDVFGLLFWQASGSSSREPQGVCQCSYGEREVCQRASWATLRNDTHTALMKHLKLRNVQQQQSSVLLTVGLSCLSVLSVYVCVCVSFLL